jgi:hypothetical protein
MYFYALKSATSPSCKPLKISSKTMPLFDHILGKTIVNIQRLDSEADYEFYSPNAIIFTLDNSTEKLFISVTNDGSSVDIRMSSEEKIAEDHGLEFSEQILNDLKKNDELSVFIGDRLKSIKIAEFILPEITGSNFVLKQGIYAGLEVKTSGHKLLFQNNYGGWCDIDDDEVELPNPGRWQWK